MNYSAELNLIANTFKKYGVQVAIADLNLPPTENLGKHFLNFQQVHTPLRDLITPLSPATVYTKSVYLCHYIYFLLPDLQPEALMVFGPFLVENLSPGEIWEQVELQHADGALRNHLEKFYSSLPIFPRSSHLHLLLDAFFDRIWGIGGYTSETISQNSPSDAAWVDRYLTDQEDPLLSATIMEERYAFENQLMTAVRQGQLRRVESFMTRITPNAFEMRVADPVRNLKNYCIITNTLLRKAAEEGGVHPIYIDRTSADFARRIEQISSPAAGPALISEMAQVYCRLVRKHATQQYSAPIQNAVLLIEGNLSGDLSLAKLAKELNVNGSYLSALFKKETGSTLTDFITQRRISHAKHLLESTRLQIQTVGQHCGFDDVHYFSKVFKRQTGLTPKQFRQKGT